MVMCVQCGSTRIVKSRGTLVARLVAAVLRQQVQLCLRCGWRGRSSRRATPLSKVRSRTSGDPVTEANDSDAPELDLRALDEAFNQPRIAQRRPLEWQPD